MPDDVGGRPFPDGEEPDSHHRHGDDEFASVVFDEEFVRSAAVHEPSAAERMRAARARSGAGLADDDGYGDVRDGPRAGGRPWCTLTDDLDPDDAYGPYGRYGTWRRPYRGRPRWQRPVAWALCVLMGVGVVAFAFAAVYRGASSGDRREPAPPPATTGVDTPAPARQGALPGPARPSVSADSQAPVASAVPRHG
ncbi:hypothetical protein I5Q34_02280 [Streptomyces sp. AV19]|uniref:SCO2584 family spore wall biosynthesis protein n=1 Tax=Streptomyces sp. AV19 TaxID=2793068 RepID=UPI0018FE96E9|nr:hypothetical protein [Streptomyces sp. AV19]MBH1933127.1 hypothetical protein [Streptomyces sp. AV19]MDG4531841.1 hypothetical protein [Streptomyces sp. AV19]